MRRLFGEINMHEYLSTSKKELIKYIDNGHFDSDNNIEELTQRLVENFSIKPLELLPHEPSQPIETTRRVPNYRGGYYDQKVFKVDIRIPFRGNYKLFDISPSTSTIVHIENDVDIRRDAVYANIVIDDLEENKFNAELGKLVSVLSSNIPRVNSEIAPFNNGLSALIEAELLKRKDLNNKKDDFMKAIGLDVNPRSSQFITPNPITKKKIPKPVPSKSSTIKDVVLTPTLNKEVYKDIKEVLFNVGQAFERKPSLYRDKGEDDLRDMFLLFLETRYDSTSGVGEAFNKKGKTDILLKYGPDGSNLFVAECKIWHGKSMMLKAIDQLLGYLTHRDSKTALMFFVDQKELNNVIETVKMEITEHPKYKQMVNVNHDTSIGYEFELPNDSKCVVDIEVMFFHFPKE